MSPHSPCAKSRPSPRLPKVVVPGAPPPRSRAHGESILRSFLVDSIIHNTIFRVDAISGLWSSGPYIILWYQLNRYLKAMHVEFDEPGSPCQRVYNRFCGHFIIRTHAALAQLGER